MPRGRPRNPECDECGGPTNFDSHWQDCDGCEKKTYLCRTYRDCAGTTVVVLCRCGECGDDEDDW